MATLPKLLHTLLCGLVVAAIGLSTSAAAADAASEARTRYERAVKLYEDGVYDAALVEFSRAYQLNPSYKVLYNLGQVRVAMLDFAGALEAFQQYLRDGGGQIPNARVEAVTQELSRLEQRVGRLTIQTDLSGVEVLVDDVLVGTTPLPGSVLVNSGMRRVTVRDSDHVPQTQRVSIAGGERSQVTFTLSTRPPSATSMESTRSVPQTTPPRVQAAPVELGPAASTADDAASGPRKRSLLTYTLSSVTAGLALSAGALAIAALVKNSKLDERRDRPGEDLQSFDDDRTRLRRVARAADGLALSALVGVGVSIWLWLRPERRDGEADARSAAQDRTRVSLGLTATGIQLTGDF
jgi:hypothetical protein